ncbi:MAG: glycosyltransferase family 4 protein [Fusobacteria bacterium]|nr:glycosyltransferase family 4 protein [Fusobacteriota bacterium]
MKINMISETMGKNGPIDANGVHSAFMDVLSSLKKHADMQVDVNGEGDEYDIIHSHTIGPIYIKKSKGKKYKTLVSAHVIPESMVGSIILSKYWLPFFTLWMKRAYNRASMVLAVSPTVKKRLEELNIKAKVVFMPNSINRDNFRYSTDKSYRSHYELSNEDFIVLCIGQIQTRKGVSDFIECAHKLPEVKFIWAGNRPFGKATSGFSETEKKIESAPKNCKFIGKVDRDDMPRVLNMSDVFFFPSFQENHPVAVIEAASAKLPIILRDIEEYKDIFFDCYLKGKNNDEFVEIIKKLKTDKVLYSEYMEKADIIGAEYDVKTVTEKLVNAYKEVYQNYKK